MNNKELIALLKSTDENKEVVIKLQKGLFCPIDYVVDYDGTVVLLCHDPATSAKKLEKIDDYF